MLLSVDWDYFSGCREFVFDAPIWGSPDREFDRLEAWNIRAQKRSGDLDSDFLLLEDWRVLLKLAGLPAFAALSHSSAYGLLEDLRVDSVVNLDSHHDLYSQSGDPTRVRAGNWAGLALQHGLVQHYTCIYPSWHEHLPVAEGFDLARTWQEIGTYFAPDVVHLERRSVEQVAFLGFSALLLVQSPAWTSPNHDWAFLELCAGLGAVVLEPPLVRGLDGDY